MQYDERKLANRLKWYATRLHAPDTARWQLLLAAALVHQSWLAPECHYFNCPRHSLPDEQIYSLYAGMMGWRRILFKDEG